MFSHTWKLVRRATLVLGVLFTFFVLVEMLRIFLLFYRINPVVGWLYVAILLMAAFWLIKGFIREWYAYPRALKPPPLPEQLETADFKSLHAYCKYLLRYLDRLSDNACFEEEDLNRLDDGINSIVDALKAHPLRDDLIREIEQTEIQVIAPLLDKLKQQASKEIRHSVRDVMLGVTLSPYHSMDIFVVIYRNASMVLRIVKIFESRPQGKEQLLVLRDTLRVVATVNMLNLGKNIFENLFAQIPIIGRSIDDMGQGIGAGLLTSASGYAAIERCAAFRGWDKGVASVSLAGQAARFLADVKDLFTKDVLPNMKNRICSTSAPDAVNEPGFWDNVTRGIMASFDASAKTVDALVVKPVAAGTKVVTDFGMRTAPPQKQAVHIEKHTSRHHSGKRPRGTQRVLRTFGQRIRYTLFPGKR